MNTDSQSFNRLTISRHDFERCQDFLQSLQALDWSTYGSIPFEGLLLSAIIFYARPFSGNERDKTAQAASRVDPQVINHLTTQEMELHEKILLLRNKAIAHAEWTYHPTRVSENGVIASMPFSIWKYFTSRADIKEFANLVSKILLRMHHLSSTNLQWSTLTDKD